MVVPRSSSVRGPCLAAVTLVARLELRPPRTRAAASLGGRRTSHAAHRAERRAGPPPSARRRPHGARDVRSAMRALTPLLLLLAAAATAATETSPPALLVLRAACPAPLNHLFQKTSLQQYEPARPLLASHRLRALSYEETCGPEWRQAVTRASLAALSEGSAVLSAGWPGADACEALVAGARALRRPPPVVCAVGEARGAAVAHLARELRWSRVLLPPATPRSECAAALRDIARALTGAGLALRRAPLTIHEMARKPHVVILCASHRGTWSGTSGASLGDEGSGPPLLLVHVEDPNQTPRVAPLMAPSTSRPVTNQKINDAFQLSNISLVLSQSLYSRSTQNKSYDKKDARDKGHNPLYSLRRRTTRSTLRSAQYREMQSTNDNTKINSVRFRSQNDNSGVIPLPGDRQSAVIEFLRSKTKGESRGSSRVRRRELSHTLYSDFQVDYVDALLSRLRVSYFKCLLLLTDEDLHTQLSEDDVYQKITEAIESDSKSERTRSEYSKVHFHLYEQSNSSNETWQRAVVLETTSSRSLDSAEEWQHAVNFSNVSVDVDTWIARAPREERNVRPAGGALWAGVVSCTLALASIVALLVRWMARRRRRRRRREDAVLSPVDFTFPVDEPRRVGEGMETMLSCWLQQLHEFGGPELERPDLLKQPPRAAPLVPSAPSSTCSVNRVTVDRRIRYKGDVVHVKYLPGTTALELKRKATDVLLVMQNLRHENLNPFIGCLCEIRAALVFDHCLRGSLEDVLMADEIKLDWTFRLSLLTDLVKGMRYLHSSPLRVHGRLTSRNCVVDSRWVLRVTDYGLPTLHRTQGIPHAYRSARDLLWTAPELLREPRGEGRGSQSGDVFSFAIIMQEVIVRGEPYCMLSLTPDEIVEKVSRPPPLIRPSVSMGAAPPEAVSVMRQCWSEAPDLRPDFSRLHDIFRHLHRGRKINIVDSMFEMLEKYSNNLEELIRERTEQLDMEKKKTEQLLNRMLPRSVAERLLLGSRVEPEEFAEVSIYFSDIVGFTALAARSTPVQVVDLLNDLYTTFDAAIEQYRVYKVETIGDAYMVVGGLPVRTQDHAQSIATMALHLLHLAGRFRIRHLPDTPLHLRIGLHSGPCCAAVVGLTMPRYCLFGDTVNTASRMESTGAAWRIQVSATTAEHLSAAGGYRLRSRGLTQIKGKGAMHTYWLLGKDGFDKPLPTPPALESEEVLFETDGENESDTLSARTSTPVRNSSSIEPRTDPLTTPDKQAMWQQSGAVSADSSPPRIPRTVHVASSVDQSAQYSRYRCLGNGRRPLRRQWSLERGDALAAAAAGAASASAPPSPPEPLALLSAAPPAPRAAARYRTRPERDAPPHGPP
ncbi:unnamed protein product [Arctia plantaginis]|uniref:guanylate cyclase n=1 Tax=Arctia plantaginis TaxID=874455 RepID=A0A8S0YM05_ARCPL|nr:unnamed protein product [Arctia plantaginis]